MMFICTPIRYCSFAVRLQCNMHLVEEHYYTFNKVFLKILGIWPHEKSRLVFLQRVLIITLVITYIIFQVIVYISKTILIVLCYIFQKLLILFQ